MRSFAGDMLYLLCAIDVCSRQSQYNCSATIRCKRRESRCSIQKKTRTHPNICVHSRGEFPKICLLLGSPKTTEDYVILNVVTQLYSFVSLWSNYKCRRHVVTPPWSPPPLTKTTTLSSAGSTSERSLESTRSPARDCDSVRSSRQTRRPDSPDT